MCSNYQPVTREDRLLTFFGVDMDPGYAQQQLTAEIWPLGLAPFIRLAEDGSGARSVDFGQFGMMPPFRAELSYGRKTYNARTESIHERVTYKDAWARGQRCVIPAEAIFEPCYETGEAVRWCIQQYGQVPMGIAGIYRRSTTKAGKEIWSFAMLTVNADGHPVFQRMHRPEDEKRMVVILDPADYGDWLTCSVDAARRYWRQWTGELEAFPAPLPARHRKARPPVPDVPEPPWMADPDTGELF